MGPKKVSMYSFGWLFVIGQKEGDAADNLYIN